MALDSKNIIVGAAELFFAPVATPIQPAVVNQSYAATMKDTAATTAGWLEVGYTSNGLELTFAPEFGEVQVDQVLDVAKLFKSGMTVTLNTTMAETTLENLAFALATSETVKSGAAALIRDKDGTPATAWDGAVSGLDLSAGGLGECPVEKSLVAVGPGPGECSPTEIPERIYTAFRVLSIDSVSLAAKRDEASMFDVSFRLLPDSNGYYGQIVDRTYTKP